MDEAARLQRLLVETVLPFWSDGVRDGSGGYRLNHDRDSAWRGPAPKALVTQARTLWFFSRLCRSPYGTPEHAALAKHGYAFLTARMWDDRFGGFYWEVGDDGRRVTKDAKQLYGQAFALYALSEFADAFDDAFARQKADDLFALIDEKAHDGSYGGYVESFDRAWTSIAPGYLRPGPPMKLLNTHLHLLEAVTRYYASSRNPAAWERIIELLLIVSNAAVRKSSAACTDVHTADWRPAIARAASAVSYGHTLEAGWILAGSCETIGLPVHPLLDLICALTDTALRDGFDAKRGGFYHTGPLNKRARDRTKVWWVQAEALVALCSLWRRTGEARYYNAFVKTLDWIETRQADWANGEWFAEIDARGRPGGVKTGPWKGPYHHGRALLECLDLFASA